MTHTMGESISFVLVAMTAIGAYLIWAIFRGWQDLGGWGFRRWRSAWGISFSLVGWLPPLGAAILTLPLVLWAPLTLNADLAPFEPQRVAASILPLFAACHAAFIFAPNDEPFLEGLLITPRPLIWLIWERLLVLAAPYLVIGLTSNLIAAARMEWHSEWLLLNWFPPLVFFIGVALFITFTSRQPAFGMTMCIILWFGLAFMADKILLQWAHLWFVHVYLRPQQAATAFDPRLHTLWVLFVGALLLAFAFRQLTNHEKLLYAAKS